MALTQIDLLLYSALCLLVLDAPVVKLAYTLGSGPSGRKAVEVQLLSGAPAVDAVFPIMLPVARCSSPSRQKVLCTSAETRQETRELEKQIKGRGAYRFLAEMKRT